MNMIGLTLDKAQAEELLKVVQLYVEYDNEYATGLIADLSSVQESNKEIIKYQINNILESITTLSDIEKKLLEFLKDSA